MKKEYIFIIVLVVIIGGISALAFSVNKKNNIETNPALATALSTTAQCLKDSGAKFYGASWCPHCARQKALFMKSVKIVPYVECAKGGAGSPQTQVCIDAKIQSYPTWEFATDLRGSLEIAPADLAVISNCSVTEEERVELAKQKDEFMTEMEAKQKDAYVVEIKRLQDAVAALKK